MIFLRQASGRLCPPGRVWHDHFVVQARKLSADPIHPTDQGRPGPGSTIPTSSTAPHGATSTSKPAPSVTPRTDHTFRLDDGRDLSFALYGPTEGRPVVFLHGLPSCRLEAEGISTSGTLEQSGVRLIVPERPGFGRSSPARERTIMSYTDDIEALVSYLGLEGGHVRDRKAVDWTQREYSVMGGSGGGPYAVACAFEASRSPHRFSNMHKVGLFAAAPPYVSPLPHLRRVADHSINSPTSVRSTHRPPLTEDDTRILRRDWMIKSRLVFGLAKRMPHISHALANTTIEFSSWVWRTHWGRKKIDKSVRAFLSKHGQEGESHGTDVRPALSGEGTAAPRALLDKETASFIELARETWRQGPDGWLDEVRLLGAPWGFDPASIEVRPSDTRPGGLPLKIWHGEKDENAPLTSIRWLADRIPGSELEVVRGKGHFGLGESLKDMLQWAGTKQDNSPA